MCKGCPGTEKGYNPKLVTNSIPLDLETLLSFFEFRAIAPIKVTVAQVGGKIRVTHSYEAYIVPTVNISVSPTTAEIGDSVDPTFTVTFEVGSQPLTSKELTPAVDPEPDMTSSPFGFQIDGLTSTVPGIFGIHRFTVEDGTEVEIYDEVGVSFMHRYFQWFSDEATTDEATMIAGSSELAASAVAAWGGTQAYIVPNLNYIYWAVPEDDEDGIGQPYLGSFPLPVTVIGQITRADNGFGVPVTYNIIRTTNYFGASTLNITIE